MLAITTLLSRWWRLEFNVISVFFFILIVYYVVHGYGRWYFGFNNGGFVRSANVGLIVNLSV